MSKKMMGTVLCGIVSVLSMVLLMGCTNSSTDQVTPKTFVYGTTGYGPDMDDVGLNPHDAYSGWSAVRYGVGETLFKFSDDMQPEPWLAQSYSFVDDVHCVITLREGVQFSSGRALDGQAVKECLDHLISTHKRAASDLKITQITADNNSITIQTSEPCPALINYLCDPYGAIIDMQQDISEDKNVSGTGPYVAESVSDTEIVLKKNDHYWGEAPKIDRLIVRAISDGDTLTSALQSGEIDAAYGMPYASYQLFENSPAYSISSCSTSRTFFGQVNYHSLIMQDAAVRKALSLGIDKQGFITTLLNGHGVVAQGPFPANLTFGDLTVSADVYDPAAAKRVLEEAGWIDQNGDGIREKNGQPLVVRWLTYPGRMELPLLAEYAQATLRDIGFDVQVNNTVNHTKIRKDQDAWDVYMSALVTAPTGDPEYFFTASCLSNSTANYGAYANATLNEQAQQMHTSFDFEERCALATSMQQQLLQDHSHVFVSHLTMGIVTKSNVTGISSHPCDYYEITSALDKQ